MNIRFNPKQKAAAMVVLTLAFALLPWLLRFTMPASIPPPRMVPICAFPPAHQPPPDGKGGAAASSSANPVGTDQHLDRRNAPGSPQAGESSEPMAEAPTPAIEPWVPLARRREFCLTNLPPRLPGTPPVLSFDLSEQILKNLVIRNEGRLLARISDSENYELQTDAAGDWKLVSFQPRLDLAAACVQPDSTDPDMAPLLQLVQRQLQTPVELRLYFSSAAWGHFRLQQTQALLQADLNPDEVCLTAGTLHFVSDQTGYIVDEIVQTNQQRVAVNSPITRFR